MLRFLCPTLPDYWVLLSSVIFCGAILSGLEVPEQLREAGCDGGISIPWLKGCMAVRLHGCKVAWL